LEHTVSFATWHPDASNDALTAFTQALPINFSAKGNPSRDCDFLISHRIFSTGLAHVTQTGPAKAIAGAMDRPAPSQSTRCLHMIFHKANMVPPQSRRLKSHDPALAIRQPPRQSVSFTM
jgi:hypothetical protein